MHFDLCEGRVQDAGCRYAILIRRRASDGAAREKSRFPLLGAYYLCA